MRKRGDEVATASATCVTVPVHVLSPKTKELLFLKRSTLLNSKGFFFKALWHGSTVVILPLFLFLMYRTPIPSLERLPHFCIHRKR